MRYATHTPVSAGLAGLATLGVTAAELNIANLSDLVGWWYADHYDASAGVVLDRVNDEDFTYVTTAPSKAAAINGLPTIEFTLTAAKRLPGSAAISAAAYTAIAVAKTPSSSGGVIIGGRHDTQWWAMNLHASTGRLGLFHNGLEVLATSSVDYRGSPRLITMAYGAGAARIRSNGTQVASAASGIVAPVDLTTQLGARGTSSPGGVLNGSIAAVLLFSGDLTAAGREADLALVESLLAARYGITLP